MAKSRKPKLESDEALQQRVRLLSRELEIEAALEKVRSRAMSMRSTNMLAETSAVMFKQIQALGIDATRCGVGIFDDAHDAMEVWLTTASAGEKVMRVLDYVNLHVHPVYENILAARKKRKAYAITLLKGEEVKHYYNTMSAYMAGTGRKVVSKEEAYQSFFFDQGTINITTAKPLSEEERIIMVRFAKVFGLIYLRFVDLQKAEAQASEARIEASLERVRSRSLAMRKSKELSDVAVILYKELQALGVTNFFNCGFVEVDTQENIQYGWMTRPKGKWIEGFKLPLVGDPVLQERFEAWQRQDPVFYQSVGGSELKEHLNFVRPTIGSKDVDKKVTTKLPDPTVFYAFNFTHGYLHIISDGLLNTDEEVLTARFAKVFEIAYRRFLDLKLAEGQTREAEIELGLERVRARAMAMQRSDELAELVATVFRELNQLDFALSSCIIWIHHPGNKSNALWIASDKLNKPAKPLEIIPFYPPFFESIIAAWRSQDPKWVFSLTGTEKKKFDKLFFRQYPELPKALKISVSNNRQISFSASFNRFGALEVVATEPLSEEKFEILHRFGKVFNSSYTRFHDLQKAEAQAKEAQIEAALERVRSRSMAMHKSDELAEVITVIAEQLGLLQIRFDNVSFALNDNSNGVFFWISVPGWATPFQVRVPYIENSNLTNLIAARQQGRKFHQDNLTQKENKAWTEHVFAHNKLDLPDKVRAYMLESGFARSVAIMPNIMLVVGNYLGKPYRDEVNQIIQRFAGVFEQAYTRFLDLQKAEAQAREAQVQLALERVRARTMAMQSSAELAEVSFLLNKQVVELGIPTRGCAFNIYNESDSTEWFSNLEGTLPTYKTPRENIFLKYYEAGQRGETLWVEEFGGARIKEHYEYLFSVNILAIGDEHAHKINESIPDYQVDHVAYFKYGYLLFITLAPAPEAHDVFRRFAKEFEQTYTRFLDLQKAEAQAREGQIQLAMERVRARTMAMQTSAELPEAANLLFQQVQSLGMPAWSAGYCIWDDDKKAITLWMSSEGVLQPSFKLPLTEDPSCIRFLEAHQRGETFFVEEIGGEELVKHYTYMRSLPVVGEVLQSIIDAGFPLPTFQIFHCAYFSKGFLLFITYQPVPEAHDIFKRFGKVFEQTYTRFLDLQKAEAQAREAQIEAALEKVRSRSLAMHKSGELQELIYVLFAKLNELHLPMDAVSIGIPHKDSRDIDFWIATPHKNYATSIFMAYVDFSISKNIVDAWQEGHDYFAQTYSFEEKNKWWQYAFEHTGFKSIPDERKKIILESRHTAQSVAITKNSMILVTNHSDKLLIGENAQVLKRFARVFEQSYVRFLDLQKAEAQAREAQIEAALERVRSRSMAMHQSEELSDCAELLFSELSKLGGSLWSSGFAILSEDDRADGEFRTTDQFGTREEVAYIPNQWDPTIRHLYEGWKQGIPYRYQDLGGEEIKQHYAKMVALPRSGHIFQAVLDAGSRFPDWQQMHAAYFKQGYLLVISLEHYDDSDLLVRFARVFEQTYTRFLDLKRAEAQAREATIQASLERVRAKAMAMHNSEDLSATVDSFFSELRSLGVTPRRCGVTLIDKETRIADLTATTATAEGESRKVTGKLKLAGHPVLDQVYHHWNQQKEYHPMLRGKEIGEYYRVMNPQVAFPEFEADEIQFGHYFFFNEGGVYAWTEKEMPDEALNIYRRFTSVLSLTYKRYKDLKDAEARAREAVKQASLDRVRAEIASMRHADDLQRITPLIWRELRTLGVPFFRCGVLIVNEKNQKADYYLSTPEGHPLAALHLDFSTEIQVVQAALEHWRQQKVFTEHWNKEQFVAFARSMMEIGQIQTMKSYQGGDQPPESITLQFTPFAQGMLYVGSAEDLTDDQINLVQALADSFSTAYARYEDFTRLEAAKATVEKTLSELRTTQNQLVQSEKMASLGELTAGIAHEIQNPLNFVNNFSEVSKELLEEMEAELQKGNSEDALQIAKDIIQNLEKITLHGKRADGIVKSMLQHSRKSTGQKELTDINALCDEYLRLSYHGLRAKDKSFNAKFETDLDPSVGQISVLPQEIGRVVLNLINNAFYAVSEKKKLNLESYEPTVTVTTRKSGNTIEISVTDNGTGIPQKALDKIFQPFFTTKPTGQGTGLGLSLSYDIVKAHGGQLTVETAEGTGTTFTILLNAS